MDRNRKLMVLGINKLIDEGLILLDGKNERGHIMTVLECYPTMISWQKIGREKLQVTVWWKYDHHAHPQTHLRGNVREDFSRTRPLTIKTRYHRFVGVTVTGWLELKTEPNLQGQGPRGMLDVYTRTREQASLDAIPTPEPQGYQAESKHLW